MQALIHEMHPSWRMPRDGIYTDSELKDRELTHLRQLYDAGFRVVDEGHRCNPDHLIPAARRVVISYRHENRGVPKGKGKGRGSSERRDQSRGRSPYSTACQGLLQQVDQGSQ